MSDITHVRLCGRASGHNAGNPFWGSSLVGCLRGVVTADGVAGAASAHHGGSSVWGRPRV
eukprot:1911475-Pyramimonas_sp.AAC.1